MASYGLSSINLPPCVKGAMGNGVNLVRGAWNYIQNILPPTNVASRTFEKGTESLTRVAPEILHLLTPSEASRTPASRSMSTLPPLDPTWLARSAGFAAGARSCQPEIDVVENENTFLARALTITLALFMIMILVLFYLCCRRTQGKRGLTASTQTTSESGTDLSLNAENNALQKRLAEQKDRCQIEKDELRKMLRLTQDRSIDLSRQLTDVQGMNAASVTKIIALEKATARPVTVDKDTQTTKDQETQVAEAEISSDTGISKSGLVVDELRYQIAQLENQKKELQRQNDDLLARFAHLHGDDEGQRTSRKEYEDLLQTLKNVEQTVNEINERTQEGASPMSSIAPSEKGDSTTSDVESDSEVSEEDVDDNAECNSYRCHKCPYYAGEHHHVCSKQLESKLDIEENLKGRSKDDALKKIDSRVPKLIHESDEEAPQSGNSKAENTTPPPFIRRLAKLKHREPIPPTPKVLDITIPPRPQYPPLFYDNKPEVTTGDAHVTARGPTEVSNSDKDRSVTGGEAQVPARHPTEFSNADKDRSVKDGETRVTTGDLAEVSNPDEDRSATGHEAQVSARDSTEVSNADEDRSTTDGNKNSGAEEFVEYQPINVITKDQTVTEEQTVTENQTVTEDQTVIEDNQVSVGVEIGPKVPSDVYDSDSDLISQSDRANLGEQELTVDEPIDPTIEEQPMAEDITATGDGFFISHDPTELGFHHGDSLFPDVFDNLGEEVLTNYQPDTAMTDEQTMVEDATAAMDAYSAPQHPAPADLEILDVDMDMFGPGGYVDFDEEEFAENQPTGILTERQTVAEDTTTAMNTYSATQDPLQAGLDSMYTDLFGSGGFVGFGAEEELAENQPVSIITEQQTVVGETTAAMNTYSAPDQTDTEEEDTDLFGPGGFGDFGEEEFAENKPVGEMAEQQKPAEVENGQNKDAADAAAAAEATKREILSRTIKIPKSIKGSLRK